MIDNEKMFYFTFLLLLSIFCFTELTFIDATAASSLYFAPTGLLRIFDYSTFVLALMPLKILLWIQIGLAFAKPRWFAGSRVFNLILLLQILLLTGFRFSFSHYPYLETIPSLALFGFVLGRTKLEKLQFSYFFVSFTYFFSGLAKLRFSGLGWFSPESFYFIIHYSNTVRSGWAMHIMDVQAIALLLKNSFLTALLAGATILYELAFPFALLSRKVMRVYFPLTLLFHLLIASFIAIYSTALLIPIFLIYSLAFQKFEQSENI